MERCEGPQGSQHYSLRWNNHQHHLLSAFDSLLQNESLVDCTIMCEDGGVRAHKVVLSACSPYFQKIFIDNPGKHPIIVLKDVLVWEMHSILDFMYKGETSVPEPSLTSLIKAAESLKVRGLTSSDQLPPGVSLSSTPTNLSSSGYRGSSYPLSPSPHSRYPESSHGGGGSGGNGSGGKVPHMSGGGLHSNESSPMSLTHADQMSDRASGRASPVPSTGPRRKQARPRRRSGDSVNSSLDLSKAGSPPLSYTKRESPNSVGDDHGPENLSIRRSHSPGQQHQPPAINLVKMEQLVEERRMEHENISDIFPDRDSDIKHFPGGEGGMDRPSALPNGVHHLHEQEALQALNFMASGGGLHHPLLPPPNHSPLGLGPHPFSPMSVHGSSGNKGPSTPSNPYSGPRPKGQHSAPRGGPPRSWTNDDLTKALEMVWNKRMTTSQASRVFGIPYNSLLMYVRGKYGKSLRLDVLKKSTPAANDNLNTIGNSRSTPKEKGLKKEKEDKSRKPSHDGFPLFPFDSAAAGGGMSPFGPSGFLPFPPLGEPMGLFGIPNADFRLKELMQSVQNLQTQQLRDNEAEKLKEANFSDSKENQDNTNKTECDVPMGLASLIMKAREFQDKKVEAEEEGEEGGTTSPDDKACEEMDTDIPQIAIKPLEVVPAAPAAAAAAIEIKIPPPTPSEISAQ